MYIIPFNDKKVEMKKIEDIFCTQPTMPKIITPTIMMIKGDSPPQQILREKRCSGESNRINSTRFQTLIAEKHIFFAMVKHGWWPSKLSNPFNQEVRDSVKEEVKLYSNERRPNHAHKYPKGKCLLRMQARVNL